MTKRNKLFAQGILHAYSRFAKIASLLDLVKAFCELYLLKQLLELKVTVFIHLSVTGISSKMQIIWSLTKKEISLSNSILNHLTGHAAISKALEPYGIGVATGEHCQNRVIFKQFFQANGFQFCQIDSCRMGGLNEVLAVLLMAAKFGGNDRDMQAIISSLYKTRSYFLGSAL